MFYFYFGNPGAERDPYRVIQDDPLGIEPPTPGPAADGWLPRAGLVLTTMRRPPDVANPDTVEQFRALVEQSGGRDGAAYRDNIRDGLNPFGDSDHYLSLYHGWLRIPKDGQYTFCTASNEASFSFINGNRLVHWPGRHTEKRGKLGQKHAAHTLDAGLHYVTYLHEEVQLYQVAFLGVKRPGNARFVKLPKQMLPRPHRAQVQRYDRRGAGRTVMPRIEMLDSIWPRQRDAGQYTRYRFSAATAQGDAHADWSFEWAFGDGVSATGGAVQHVYLTTGDHRVTLNATAPDGRMVTRDWPITVFPIEHLAGPFKRGARSDYMPIVRDYQPDALSTEALMELARFQGEAGAHEAARRAALSALERDGLDTSRRGELHQLAAGGAGLPGSLWWRDRDEAAQAHLQRAMETATEPAPRVTMTARLIRLADDLDRAQQLFDRAQRTAKQHGMSKAMRSALRDATLALGDAHLVRNRFDGAEQHYHAAEALARPRIPRQVRVARTGTYPQRIESALVAGRLNDARTIARQWRTQFPADLLTGEPLFWLGRVAMARDLPADGVRPLDLATELGEGTPFEGEAYWRLAEAHGALGHNAARRRTLRALVETGLASEWRDKAIAALGNGE